MNVKLEVIWNNKDIKYTSIGYLVEDNPNYLIISSTLNENSKYILNTTKILYSNIFRINELFYEN
jgi:hypothetical protein